MINLLIKFYKKGFFMRKEIIIKKVIAKIAESQVIDLGMFKKLKQQIADFETDLNLSDNYFMDDSQDYYYNEEDQKEIYEERQKNFKEFESAGKDLLKELKKILLEKNFDKVEKDKHLSHVLKILNGDFRSFNSESNKNFEAINYWIDKK
jgi:hypothetical protein